MYSQTAAIKNLKRAATRLFERLAIKTPRSNPELLLQTLLSDKALEYRHMHVPNFWRPVSTWFIQYNPNKHQLSR